MDHNETRDDRQRGDAEGDRLVAAVLGEDEHRLDGRLGYNHLLDIADALVEAPELAFAPGSVVKAELDAYREVDPELPRFFDPVEAPAWLDEAKLAHASRIWQSNMLTSIGVLYAASLPCCYLIEKGIPALYDTGKLADKDYVFQRIYETGLMLDAVMRPDGLRVARDLDHGADAHLEAALHAAGGGERVVWDHHKLHAESGCELDHHAVARELERRVAPKRYLWGPGFVATRKVRLLHASMRFMLLHPERFVPAAVTDDRSLAQGLLSRLREQGWRREDLGLPVNQEDLAYTLLTFGLVIPEGLARWHVRLDDADREAFLHLWRVVGFVLGIEDHLLPTSWAHGQEIRARIAARQAGGSKMGQDMTRVLMGYLQDYLPTTCGLKERLPAWLIRDQMGAEADKVLDQPARRAARSPVIRLLGLGMHLVLWIYFLLRRILFALAPPLARLVSTTFEDVGQALIASWKDVYRRRPFYIPDDATTWKRKHGVNVPFLKTLMGWRRQLFRTILIGTGLWVGAVIAAAAGGIAAVFDQGWWTWCVWAAIAAAIVGMVVLQALVPRCARRRPRLQDQELCVVV